MSHPYTWESTDLNETYDVLGYMLYPPHVKYIDGRERGDRKQYRCKLYQNVHNCIEVNVETKSLDSEVFINIAANFRGAMVYIEDCTAISSDIFEVDRSKITLTVINFDDNKVQFQKFDQNPSVIFNVDRSLSTHSIDSFICPTEMQSSIFDLKRLHRLRKTWMDFPAQKISNIKSLMAREIYHREHRQFIEQKEIAERVHEIDPYKYISTENKITKKLLYNHVGFLDEINQQGEIIEFSMGDVQFVLQKSAFPKVCEKMKPYRLIVFPFNVKAMDENTYTLKYDELLTLEDDRDNLNALQQVRKMLICSYWKKSI